MKKTNKMKINIYHICLQNEQVCYLVINVTERHKEALNQIYLFQYSVSVQYICKQGNVFLPKLWKINLWQSVCCYFKYKFCCCKCFMVNLMNIYKMDSSSGVFVDLKSSTMHDWLKTFQSLVLALLIFLSEIKSINGFSGKDIKVTYT